MFLPGLMLPIAQRWRWRRIGQGDIRPEKGRADEQMLIGDERGAMAGGAGLHEPGEFHINGGGGDAALFESEARTFGNEASTTGDHGIAVVDGATGFIADEVGVDVTDPKSARAFEDKTFADFGFAEGEVTGAGIEDEVGSVGGQQNAGTLGDPGVFANFETDADATDIEQQIADGDGFAFGGDVNVSLLHRPGFEPAGFVVESIASQMAFGDEAEEPAVHGQCHAVENRVLMEHGEAEGDDQPPGFGKQFLQGCPGSLAGVGAEEGILAAITGDAEFGKAEDGGSLGTRGSDRLQNPGGITVPIERSLIQNGSGEMQEFHAWIEEGALRWGRNLNHNQAQIHLNSSRGRRDVRQIAIRSLGAAGGRQRLHRHVRDLLWDAAFRHRCWALLRQ